MTGYFKVFDLFGKVRRYHLLLLTITKRDIFERYQGQILGSLWYVGHPLLIMAVYIFLFGVVLKVRLQTGADMPLDYTCYILAGLIPWLPTAETLSRSPSLLPSHAHIVKNIVFPVEILPIKVTLVSGFTMAFTLAAFIIYALFQLHSFPVTYILLPVLLILHLMFLVGLSLVISSVGVFFRDLKDVLQVFLLMIIYITPIFYLPTQVPAAFRPILYVNPFSHLIWCYQDVLYFGRIEHPWSWGIFGLLAWVLLAKGYDLFDRMRVYFGNAL